MRVMNVTALDRPKEFVKLQDEGIIFKICSKDGYNHYEYDQYYDYTYYEDNTWILEYIFYGALLLIGYGLLSLAGAFLYPPLLICFLVTDGDLEACSLGLWDNSYQEYTAYTDYEYDYYESDYFYWDPNSESETSDRLDDIECTLI